MFTCVCDAGDIGALFDVLNHALKLVAGEQRHWLSVFVGRDFDVLADVQAQFGQAADLARALSKVQKEKDFASFLHTFVTRVQQLKPKEKMLVPGGWRNPDGVRLSAVHTR